MVSQINVVINQLYAIGEIDVEMEHFLSVGKGGF